MPKSRRAGRISVFHRRIVEDWKQLEQLIKTTFSFFGGEPPADLEAGRGCARISEVVSDKLFPSSEGAAVKYGYRPFVMRH